MIYAKGSANPLKQGLGNNGEYFTITLDSEGINFLKPKEGWQWPEDMYLIIPYTLNLPV
ncbi:MAG: hypothetical protein IPN33_23050 [Saprospiraceae bacterium]|nr:hypothetical protein [Saprospiraceae bacterium]